MIINLRRVRLGYRELPAAVRKSGNRFVVGSGSDINAEGVVPGVDQSGLRAAVVFQTGQYDIEIRSGWLTLRDVKCAVLCKFIW